MGALGTGVPFWDQVTKTGECWEWTGARSPNGYGVAYRPSSQSVTPAHRYAYEQVVGPIPAGLQLDHLCRNRQCVNPAHLEPVTARENQMRSPFTMAAINAAKTHCKHGHEFTSANTYTHPKRGTRDCRTCRSNRDGKAA